MAVRIGGATSDTKELGAAAPLRQAATGYGVTVSEASSVCLVAA